MGEQINAAVLTISDSRVESDDVSGNQLASLISEIGNVVEKQIVSDDLNEIINILSVLTSRPDINLIITSGGTGLGPRDNTPEATLAIIEREVPGLSEAMRQETLKETQMAMLSRGICGIRGETLIINLPGSPKAVKECFEVIGPVLSHAVSLLSGNTQHDE